MYLSVFAGCHLEFHVVLIHLCDISSEGNDFCICEVRSFQLRNYRSRRAGVDDHLESTGDGQFWLEELKKRLCKNRPLLNCEATY